MDLGLLYEHLIPGNTQHPWELSLCGVLLNAFLEPLLLQL